MRKMRFLSTWAGVLVLAAAGTGLAAPFVNLDFEQGMVPNPPTLFIPAALAFPGWTARIGEVPQAVVAYDFSGIGEAEVVLYDTFLGQGGFFVLQGTFSAALYTDRMFNLPASLSQTGDVPPNVRSLRFLADHNIGNLPAVTINGTPLHVVQLSPVNGFDPVLFGADITAFAGTIIELRFSSGPFPGIGSAAFDNVNFSSVPVPEGTFLWPLVALASEFLKRAIARPKPRSTFP